MKDIINAINELQESINKAEDKHMKGYIYDSLMYRYMRAREAMAELESIKFKLDKNFTQKNAQRDMCRFSEILNEAIGEHD